jgi:hypothetical protein
MKLAPVCKSSFHSRLSWLESMLYRLGKEVTLAIWTEAFRVPDDGSMRTTLAEGWEPYEDDDGQLHWIDRMIESLFASPVEGVTKAKAHGLVMMEPGIRLSMERHPKLTVKKNVTTYDALHIRLDGMARLAATLQEHLGKEGELIAYDMIRESRIARARAAGPKREPADVLKEWAAFAKAKEPNIFNAGQNVELIKETDSELIIHVTACEWARYFRERHPTVAYLVSCSTDEADLRTVTDGLRMQRTSTIMEGGKVCDFRVYTV